RVGTSVRLQPDRVSPCDQQLRRLLRDRRSALDQPAIPEVAGGGARERDRIHTGVRPEAAISGAYISSTCAGATTNDPDVVARTTYENSWWPSARRVANSSTRSSCRSTRSKVPRFQTSSQLGASVPSCSSVCLAMSAAVVLNHDSTGSKPAGIGSVTAT